MSHDNLPRLGAPVRFTKTLHRRYHPAAPRSRRTWDASHLWLVDLARSPDKALDGIVVGIRALSDGECEDGYYDTPTVYYPTRTFTAYLVAWHLRRKPVLVLPEHVELLDVPAAQAATGVDQPGADAQPADVPLPIGVAS